MGWCGATEIMDAVIEASYEVAKAFSGPAAGEPSITAAVDDIIRPIVARVAKKLCEEDWDCQPDSEYYDRFAQEMHDFTDEEYFDHLHEQHDGDLSVDVLERMTVLQERIQAKKQAASK